MYVYKVLTFYYQILVVKEGSNWVLNVRLGEVDHLDSVTFLPDDLSLLPVELYIVYVLVHFHSLRLL